MKWAYSLSGADPKRARFQIGATIANIDTFVMLDAAFAGQAIPVTATSSLNTIGLSEEVATYTATPTGDAASVMVNITPGSVYKSRVTTGATSGVAITEFTETDGDAANLVHTDAALPATAYDNVGTIVVTSGNNRGQLRQIESEVAGTSATVTTAFPNDIAVGDTFFLLPFSAGQSVTAQLTTDLTEVRNDIAVGTGIDIRVVNVKVDIDDPLNKTFIYFTLIDHIYGQTT